MKRFFGITIPLVLLLAVVAWPVSASAAVKTKTKPASPAAVKTKTVKKTNLSRPAPFYYDAWIPYWRKASGALEISIHLDKFQEISPFSYEVKAEGTPVDKLKITQGFWPTWLLAARDLRIKNLPTVAWFDGEAIHQVLSATSTREAHIEALTALVMTNKFDGIDIDYENKKAETNPYFSEFIKGLSQKLHLKNKLLSCTVEPRTPPEARFKEIPAELQYANDYQALNRYCDEVRIIAYDQGRVDLLLNQEKGAAGQYYIPIADPAWVEKVIQETAKTIDKKKIMLGIPTYGYEYAVRVVNGQVDYQRVRSLTYADAQELARSLKLVPTRNSAGELSFTYNATSTAGSGGEVGSSTRLVWFTDAPAMADKIKLARKYQLRGVIFFKFDGETDPALWQEIK
jgi:spore germination protein